jgi:hypothetical protein
MRAADLAARSRISDAIRRHRGLFDLTRDDLGRNLCKAATDGVQGCFATETDPDGNRWPDLSPAYEQWKSFQFPGDPIGVLFRVMANPREVAGDIQVSDDLAVVTYGISEQARQEATWFQDPQNRNQPPRKFFGLTESARAESRSILDDRLKNGV